MTKTISSRRQFLKSVAGAAVIAAAPAPLLALVKPEFGTYGAIPRIPEEAFAFQRQLTRMAEEQSGVRPDIWYCHPLQLAAMKELGFKRSIA